MLAPKDLRGVYAIMPTPSTANADDPRAVDTVDLDESARLTEALVLDGVAGVVILGTTGETPTLTPDEFRDFADCVLSTVAKRITVFVGTTALGTHEIVARSRFARERGADGIMLGLPMWQPLTTEMAVRFYASISEVFPDLPIMAYANPRAFRNNFDDALWKGIAERAPTVMSAKFSDPKALCSAIVASNGKINFLPHDGRALDFYQQAPEAVTACWSTSSSMGPSPAIAIMDALLKKDMTRAAAVAADIHWTSEPVIPILRDQEMFSIYNIQLEKTRFAAAGYCNPGPIRPPYDVLPDAMADATRECGRRWATLVATKYPLKSRM